MSGKSMSTNDFAAMIAEYIDVQTPAMFALLEKMVGMESGSYDVELVNTFGEYLETEFAALGCTLKRYPSKNTGFPLRATLLPPGSAPDARRILLVGHRDTVFPAGAVAKRPFSRDEKNCYGPGVADMKGGIVAGLYAMKALLAMRDKTGPLPIDVLLSSDEEIGSEASTPAIADCCPTAAVCFCLEPARANGGIVIERSGAGVFTIEVRGKTSHSGIAFSDGVSAIIPLAEIITEISALSDDKGGRTVNVGVMQGGNGGFSVPGHASAEVSLRFDSLELRDFLVENIRKAVTARNKGEVKATMTDPLFYLPIQRSKVNDELYGIVQDAGNAFGLRIEGVSTRGSADSGVPASKGVPTICAMGPIGVNLHSDEEYMVSASLPERTKVLALSMVNAGKQFL